MNDPRHVPAICQYIAYMALTGNLDAIPFSELQLYASHIMIVMLDTPDNGVRSGT